MSEIPELALSCLICSRADGGRLHPMVPFSDAESALRFALDRVKREDREGRNRAEEKAETIQQATVREIVEALHTPDAAWVVESARRDGCPEFAADRLADWVAESFAPKEADPR